MPANARTKQFFAQGVKIGANKYFYTRDHLGSIRELVDSSGVIRARYDYDPYGKREANQITASPVEADFGFTGHYYHAPSGLCLAPLRAYSPETGRWLSRDPIEENGGLNLYGYCGNDPINAFDPLGLAFGDLWDIQATSDYYSKIQATSESGFAKNRCSDSQPSDWCLSRCPRRRPVRHFRWKWQLEMCRCQNG